MEYEKLQKAKSQAKRQEQNLTGIPTQMKRDLEVRSGLSLDDVRVHYHSDKPAKLGALAYTQGTQVHIAPGQEGYLRHELGHVVQQKLGLVRPNARYPGGPALNTEEALEQQADAIGTGLYCQPMLSAEIPPVQRFEDPVVQAAGHIKLESPVDPGKDELSLPDAPVPTIVFEAMGVNTDACSAVYKQTKLYEGNTICVFGLNAKASDEDAANSAFTTEQTALENYQQNYDDGDGTYRHLLYTFSFKWTQIQGNNRGYPTPFVEARVLVMQEAAKIVDQLQKPDSDSGIPDQYRFLYRWIDADAKNDTTGSLDPSQLRKLARKNEAAVMTGRYDWQSMDTGAAKQNYKAFITEFNRAEKELREYYHYLSRSFPNEESNIALKKNLINSILTLQHRASFGDGERQEIARISRIVYDITETTTSAANGSDDYLPGYYYPESALMMNQTAHDIIASSFPPAGGNPDTALRRVGVPVNGAQDKESMRMLQLLGLSNSQIDFKTELSVTKPLKKEFSNETYWGAEMLAFLQKASPLSPEEQAGFIVALKNVRQSAFDPKHWYFISFSPWDEWEMPKHDITDSLSAKQELFNGKRRELKDRLLQFLDSKDDHRKTIREKIAEEIAP